MPSFARISFYNKCKALFPRFAEFNENLKLFRQVCNWRRNGWQTPLPGLMKRMMIKAEARRMGATTLVETGTYKGDTVWFFRHDFTQLISIEIHPELARLARMRFAKWPGVKIVEGDSATKLAEIVSEVKGPCAFWLDGHYSAGITGRGSKDCPIWGEFDAIIGRMKHPFIILIDDARCFGTESDYPTLGEVESFIRERLPAYSMQIENDIIRITPVASKV